MGVVSIDMHELRILDEASYFVRPRRWEISVMCTQLTGIIHEKVRQASSLREVLDAVSKSSNREVCPAAPGVRTYRSRRRHVNRMGLPVHSDVLSTCVDCFSRGLRFERPRRFEDSNGNSGYRVRWICSRSAPRHQKHGPDSLFAPPETKLQTGINNLPGFSWSCTQFTKSVRPEVDFLYWEGRERLKAVGVTVRRSSPLFGKLPDLGLFAQ